MRRHRHEATRTENRLLRVQGDAEELGDDVGLFHFLIANRYLYARRILAQPSPSNNLSINRGNLIRTPLDVTWHANGAIVPCVGNYIAEVRRTNGARLVILD